MTRPFLILAVLAAVLPGAALGQGRNCAPAAETIAMLTAPKYGESPLLTLRAEQGPVHLYANLATGTWTMVGFPAEAPGMACIIGAGNGIETAPLPKPSETEAHDGP